MLWWQITMGYDGWIDESILFFHLNDEVWVVELCPFLICLIYGEDRETALIQGRIINIYYTKHVCNAA